MVRVKDVSHKQNNYLSNEIWLKSSHHIWISEWIIISWWKEVYIELLWTSKWKLCFLLITYFQITGDNLSLSNDYYMTHFKNMFVKFMFF